MRRSKAWWTSIPEADRIWLVNAERAEARSGGGGGYNMPDGYGDCPMCSSPSASGLCNLCLEHHAYIIAEADAAVEESHVQDWWAAVEASDANRTA